MLWYGVSQPAAGNSDRFCFEYIVLSLGYWFGITTQNIKNKYKNITSPKKLETVIRSSRDKVSFHIPT